MYDQATLKGALNATFARTNAVRMRNLRKTLLSAASLLCLAGTARAQDANSSSKIETVVVTAEKRAENLQDVPISVTAITAALIQDKGIASALDLSGNVPNLYIKTQAGGGAKPNVFMRGMGTDDFNSTAQNAVGFYEDDVFLGATSGLLMTLFDLNRIEALRGPQGTLYGRNTTAGAIKYITNEPTSDEEGYASLTVGNYGRTTTEGAISGPLSDTFSARLSGIYDRSGGDEYNINLHHHVGSFDNFAIRGQIKWEPDANTTILLSLQDAAHHGDNVVYHHIGLNPDGTDVFGYSDPSNLGFYEVNSNAQREKTLTDGIRLKIDHDFGGFTLTSISAENHTRYSGFLDTDVSPIDNFDVYLDDGQTQYSEELRLASTGDDPLQWIGGVYAYSDRLWSNQAYDFGRDLANQGVAPDLVTLFPSLIRQKYLQHTQSYALFGEVSYQWTSKLKTTVGVRGTLDHKDIDLNSFFDEPAPNNVSQLAQGQVDPNDGIVCTTCSERNTYSAITGRFVVDYKFTDDVLGYASYNRGYKSGGYNGGAFFFTLETTPYRPESVDALEIGAKTDSFDGRLRVDVDGFYNWYHDLQAFQFSNVGGTPVSVPSNAAEATIYGGEIELLAKPIDGLLISNSLGLLHANYDKYVTALANYSGNTLIDAPSITYTGSIEYTLNSIMGWSVRPRAEVHYTSKQYFDVSNPPDQVQNGFAVVDASVNLTPPNEHYEILLWAKNLTETHYNQEITPARAFAILQPVRGAPRTFGVTLRTSF